jgi:hypothetical protein
MTSFLCLFYQVKRQNKDIKKGYFNLRLSERILNKLRVYAAAHDKTMTQVIEELIDSLYQLGIRMAQLSELLLVGTWLH